MCVVISERATSVVCVCGTDRRECVCVLLLATPNTLVLDSRYPRERDWTDVRAVDLQTDDIQQLLVPKEAEVGSLHDMLCNRTDGRIGVSLSRSCRTHL